MQPAAPAGSTLASRAWHCWDPGSLAPCHNLMENVALLPNGDGWGGGSYGAILRYVDTPRLPFMQHLPLVQH